MTYKKISSSVQSLSRVWFFTEECQASLSITNSQSLPKLMFIESVTPSNHLILCHPLLLPPSIFPRIRVFSNESALCIRWPKYWSFNFNIISTYFLIPLRLFSFSFCDPSGNWYRVYKVRIQLNILLNGYSNVIRISRRVILSLYLDLLYNFLFLICFSCSYAMLF